MEEPSVLDYVKSKLTPWKHAPIAFPEAEAQEPEDGQALQPGQPQEPQGASETKPVQARSLVLPPWRTLLALVLAVIGQRMYAVGSRNVNAGAFALIMAVAWVAWR